MIVQRDSVVGQGTFYTDGATIQAATNRLCLGLVSEAEQRETQWLADGSTAVWQVSAFDAQGRRIGASVQANRSVLVGQSLRTDHDKQ